MALFFGWQQRRSGMAETKQSPVRRGTPKNVTLDAQAAAYLVEMAPAKTQGRFLSLLLHAEYARQEERRRLRDQSQEGRGGQVELSDVGGFDEA
jgi:hypothetical protein